MTLPTNEDLRPRPEPSRQKLDEEMVRLTGTFFNTIATGLAVVGGIAPIFTRMYASDDPVVEWWQLGLISITCFVTSYAIHVQILKFYEREFPR